MQSNTMFSREQIVEYLPSIQDKKAASMLQILLDDVGSLEYQVRWQKERVSSIHDNLQKYSCDIIKNIMTTPDQLSIFN